MTCGGLATLDAERPRRYADHSRRSPREPSRPLRTVPRNAEAHLALRIRVLIIDDKRLMRAGLRALLKAQPDLHVVGAVADLDAALLQVPEVTPHVVLGWTRAWAAQMDVAAWRRSAR